MNQDQQRSKMLLPVPIIPSQDIRPWGEVIEKLMSDRHFYSAHSSMAREVSSKFVSTLSCTPLEAFLIELGDRRSGKIMHGLAYRGKPRPLKGESASQLIQKQVQQLTPEQRALFFLRLKRQKVKKPRGVVDIPIVRAPRDRDLPLSFAQQRLWFLAQMGGVSEAYHIPFGLRLKGDLDPIALRRALDRILVRL